MLNGSQEFVLVNMVILLSLYMKGHSMMILSYGISLMIHWISDIDCNIYKGLCVHIDLIPTMRLCLQWEVVRFPIGADTVYSVFIHGSTYLLYVITLSEQYYVVSDWLFTSFPTLWCIAIGYYLIGYHTVCITDGLNV